MKSGPINASPIAHALRRPIDTLRFLGAWLVPWRPAFRTRAAKSKLWFFVHHRDAIGRHIAKYGTHEPLLTRWLSDFIGAASGGIVADVGSYIGWHTLHAAQHQNIEAVIAFEPDPFNAWLLERNLAENRIEKVISDARALGATRGVAKLYRYKGSNLGRHSLAADHGYGSRQVPMADLDGALAGLGFGGHRIAAIKIDVEGYEPAVIAGARQALDRADAVILEYSPDWSRAGGLSAEDMLARMQSSGFTPFVLRSSGGAMRTNFDELRRLTGSLDVIFVRTDRLAALAPAINEQTTGSPPLQAIAEQNKQVKHPL